MCRLHHKRQFTQTKLKVRINPSRQRQMAWFLSMGQAGTPPDFFVKIVYCRAKLCCAILFCDMEGRDKTVRTALVYEGKLMPSVRAEEYFDAIVAFDDLLGLRSGCV